MSKAKIWNKGKKGSLNVETNANGTTLKLNASLMKVIGISSALFTHCAIVVILKCERS